jgi:hypothetical protein
MEDLLMQYLAFLWSQFQWDVAQMSEPWMYWWLLVPIICFVFFFVTKWALLTLPLWLPLYLALQGLRRK